MYMKIKLLMDAKKEGRCDMCDQTNAGKERDGCP